MEDLIKEIIEAINEEDLEGAKELIKEGADSGVLDSDSIEDLLSTITSPLPFEESWAEIDYLDSTPFFMRPDLALSILYFPEQLEKRVQEFGISGDNIHYCDNECMYDRIEYMVDCLQKEKYEDASIHLALSLKNFEAVKILRKAGEKFRIPKLFYKLASQEFSKEEIVQLKDLFKEFNRKEIKVLLNGLAYYSSIDFSKSFLSALIEGSLANKTLHNEIDKLLKKESTEAIVNLKKALSSQKRVFLSKKKKKI